MGAIGPNDFPCQANGYGQASGDHASSRTDPEDTESGPTAKFANPAVAAAEAAGATGVRVRTSYARHPADVLTLTAPWRRHRLTSNMTAQIHRAASGI